MTKNPVAKNPVAEEPVAEEAVAEEAVAKNPVAEEPVMVECRRLASRCGHSMLLEKAELAKAVDRLEVPPEYDCLNLFFPNGSLSAYGRAHRRGDHDRICERPDMGQAVEHRGCLPWKQSTLQLLSTRTTNSVGFDS